MTTAEDTRLYTPNDLAARWQIPVHRIREWTRDGILRCQHVGPYIYVPAQEVARFEACEPQP